MKISRPSQNYGDMYFKKENFSLYKVDGGLTGSLLDQKFGSVSSSVKIHLQRI